MSPEASQPAPTSVVDRSVPQRLGSTSPLVAIIQADGPAERWAGERVLTIEGNPAFTMSFWCGTCPLVFQRLEGANRTLSAESLTERLDHGLDNFDQAVAEAVAANLQEAEYLPLLLEIQPRLVYPGQDGDYFSEEQVETWGIEAFWGLPENPRTPYYRTPTRVVSADELLFEFVVPMVPPNWNDQERVSTYVSRLAASSRPTAVALGVLDPRQPAVSDAPEGGLVHWGLTHYLLDGHHKMEAAARSGRALRLLTLISIDQSLADDRAISRLPELLADAPVRPRRH